MSNYAPGCTDDDIDERFGEDDEVDTEDAYWRSVDAAIDRALGK